jgi:hypothetical protein
MTVSTGFRPAASEMATLGFVMDEPSVEIGPRRLDGLMEGFAYGEAAPLEMARRVKHLFSDR